MKSFHFIAFRTFRLLSSLSLPSFNFFVQCLQSRENRGAQSLHQEKKGEKRKIYTCVRGKPLLHGKVFHLHRSTFLLILLLRPDFITEL
jgi:hypothetical protein